ncbi:hypothetical protein [Collinsella ihumii]|uniref:hypothetical protein n=1 Tax=Collinsella ihumii TaxID=1720204 RepID=UPI000AD52DFA|nr:hypothetical protein [Collinsella ihumii]
MDDMSSKRRDLVVPKKSEILFWIGFWLLQIKFIWQMTTLLPKEDIVFNCLLLFGILFLGFRVAMLLPYYKCPSLVLSGIALSLSAYFLSGETVLVTTLLTVSAASGMNTQKVFRFWARAMTIILGSMIIIYIIFTIIGYKTGNMYYNIGGFRESRNALFFSHPNGCAAFTFAFAVCQCVRKDLSALSKVIYFIICSLIIFFIAGSRTSMVALLVFPISYLVVHTIIKRHLIIKASIIGYTVIAIPIILMLFTYWLSSYWFTSPLYSQEINYLLTGRPLLWWAQYSYRGLTVFGQHAFQGSVLIRGTYNEISTVDGMYASLLFNIGLAGFLFIVILISKLYKHMDQKQLDIIDIAAYSGAFISVFAFGFCEWHALNVFVCIPLLLMSEGLVLKI